jgi:hypothetical protein
MIRLPSFLWMTRIWDGLTFAPRTGWPSGMFSLLHCSYQEASWEDSFTSSATFGPSCLEHETTTLFEPSLLSATAIAPFL